MRCEVGKQSQLGTGQAHRPGAGGSGRRCHAVSHLSRLLDEGTHVRTALEHPLGLGEHRASGGGLGQAEVGSCELQPDLNREPRQAVIEQGPQPVGSCQSDPGLRMPSFVERNSCRGDVRKRAAHVVAEPRRFDERLCLLGVSSSVAPRSVAGGHERKLCLCNKDALHRSNGQTSLHGCRQVFLRAIGRAKQRMGDSANEERDGDPIASRRELFERATGV